MEFNPKASISSLLLAKYSKDAKYESHRGGSLPPSEIPSEEIAALISDSEPVNLVTVEALIIPVVFPSRILSKEASMDVLEIVTS